MKKCRRDLEVFRQETFEFVVTADQASEARPTAVAEISPIELDPPPRYSSPTPSLINVPTESSEVSENPFDGPDTPSYETHPNGPVWMSARGIRKSGHSILGVC